MIYQLFHQKNCHMPKKWFEFKKPIIALAPMADYTDQPFCLLCRKISGNDFVIFREMVSAEAIVRQNKKTLKMCKINNKERPVVIQIFGAKSETIVEAAKIIVKKFKPDGIDINMGCPVAKIAGKNMAGASLMKDTVRAAKIVKALKIAKLGVPISVKTRLGWNDKKEILKFAPILETAGADLISIHGRTKSQGYSGEVDWSMIGQAVKMVKIPVLANGNIRTVEDIKKCLDITKAAGVMIGRGAMGKPWIFREIQNLKSKIKNNKEEIKKIVLQHAKLHFEHYGERSMVTFRKHLAWYFKGDQIVELENLKDLRIKLMKINSLSELEELLKF